MGLGSTHLDIWAFQYQVFPTLILDGMALSQMDLVHDLGILLGSAPIGREVVAVAKTALAHLQIVCQFHPFLNREVLFTDPIWTTATLSTFGLPLRSSWRLQLGL